MKNSNEILHLLTFLTILLSNGLIKPTFAQVKLDRTKLMSIVDSIYCIDYPAGVCAGKCKSSGIKENTCKYLDVGGRTIQSFDPIVFQGLTSVITINLSFNVINSIPETLFQGLSRLNNIYLNSNQLTSIPANIFQGLYRLTDLNLSNNFITLIDANAFKGLFSLNVLYLESNEIVSFDRNALIENVALTKVCLYDNPISLFFPTSLQDICGPNLNCKYHITKC